MRMVNKFILIFLFSFHFAYADVKIDIPVEEIKSDYGIHAWLAENSSSPTISIRLDFKNAGYAYDSIPGIASMVAALLQEGTEKYSADTIAEMLEENGIILSCSPNMEYFTVHIKAMPESIDIAFDLLRQMLVNPNFDDKSIERIKLQHTTLIKELSENPNYIAKKKFFEVMLQKHPYLNPRYGTASSLQAITRKDLLSYVENAFNRLNLTVTVAGDIKSGQLLSLLDKYMIDLPLIAAEVNEIPKLSKFKAKLPNKVHVPMEIPQTVICFGEGGIDRHDDDFYAAYLLNAIIGGRSLDSELMKEIRGKRALTYNINTELKNHPKMNVILGTTATEYSNVEKMIDSIHEVLDNIGKNGISSDQFQNFKDYILNSFIISLNTNDQISKLLSYAQNNQLGTDYINTFYEGVRSVQIKDVNRVLERFYNSKNLLIVAVGK